MGVTIKARNSQYSFDMGAGGFFNMRKNIALALDREFGENYEKILDCHTKEEYDWNDKIANRLIVEKELDEDIIDFLYQSDCEGSISYKTCKKIYDIIKDVDFGKLGFRYVALRHNDYEELKEFLLECYKHRRKMIWR